MNSKGRPYIGGYLHVKEQLLDRFDEHINLVQYYQRYVVKKKKHDRSKKYEKRIDKKNNRIWVYYTSKRWEYPVTVYKVTHKHQQELKEI
jgi:hypothetical protein